ncbi:hypothetical protein J4771_05085 [Candidatus Kaistella beijingensis]|uniref:hypothetical protein n=1 Tax=Candidatus Kaistella beijingensis TaxID=2820270 RepID=UPI001CC6B80C|nr:hypothetical protein [Candidatus Kaistella beijingensis]UBB90723.1 hypothetical protein J4771_05085 [Candidatus Kaistella beijingensis]
MKTKIVVIIFFFSYSLLFLIKAQSLASNNTKLDARLNKEKVFADSQRKIFNITSWAGANITELINKWGNFTKKNETPNGYTVYIYETRYSGNGGKYEPGYVVSDQFGNILHQEVSKDNRYSYDFTDFYDFYVDKNNVIVKVNIGTR